MHLLITFIFITGYLFIIFEHKVHLNKAASALLTGIICWTILALYGTETHPLNENLLVHVGEISGILFFLLAAMTIVELIDSHDGFQFITERIKTRSLQKLVWIIGLLTFFMSAVLDNLTTTIVMISLIRKIITNKQQKLLFAGLIVIAANAGGAWSPLGDVSTTMLWIGGQITPLKTITSLLFPSLVCLLVPLLILHIRFRKLEIPAPAAENSGSPVISRERNFIFLAGAAVLLFVPLFKSITHLPPYMGMLMGLGIMWVITTVVHFNKPTREKNTLSVSYAMQKIDTPSILFFLGILLAVSALAEAGQLQSTASWLTANVKNDVTLVSIIGLLSSVVDNVPLVAGLQGMYGLEHYPTDHFFWQFLAYCAGTGGSALIIGSAAGVAAMGLEKINFFWYLKNISWLAIAGYLSGVLVYLVQ